MIKRPPVNLLVVGINHKTAPVKIRERFSFTKRKTEESLAKLKYSSFTQGAVILSTCNRSEVYLQVAAEKMPTCFQELRSFVFDIYGAYEAERESYFYTFEGIDALRHIFRVASGLDSQVLGETQILGQVKSSWLFAFEKGTTTESLDRIFEKALETGKRLRLETGISQGPTSIGSVAINMLEEKFKDLKERSVLIIGAGKIGALVSMYLKERNMQGIFVANRTYQRAQELAGNCAGKAVDFFGLKEQLKNVDIVISSTSSPHIVLKEEVIADIMRIRRRPLVIMDLALPRDVDPLVRQIGNVSLYDLDDLKSVIDRNQKKKQKEAQAAGIILQHELNNFLETQGQKQYVCP